jgi:hypothetical protein
MYQSSTAQRCGDGLEGVKRVRSAVLSEACMFILQGNVCNDASLAVTACRLHNVSVRAPARCKELP